MTGETYKRLYSFEKLTIGYFVFTWIFCRIYGFKINYMPGYFLYQLFGALSMGYLMICGYCVFLAIRYKGLHRAVEEIKCRYLNFDFFVESIRIIIAVTIVLKLFCDLKQIIPLVNPRIFDDMFWRADIALHFNQSPALASLKMPSSSWFWPFIDKVYFTFFIKNMIIPWIFMLQTKSVELKHRFIFAICLCWIIGGLSYFIFPALGPCFFKAGLFKGLNMPIAKRLQQSLLTEYINFRNNPLIYKAKTFYGVAAMPSLHIAIMVLFFIFSLKLNRVLACLILFCAILMFFGSIMLGWHYAVDDYAGVALAVIIYFASGYLPQSRLFNFSVAGFKGG